MISAQFNEKGLRSFVKKAGLLGIAFFFVKGLFWIALAIWIAA